MSGRWQRRMRVGFVMELVLGHVTWYQNLRRAVTALDEVDARWVETSLYDPSGLLERTPGVPSVARAGVRAWLDTHRGLRNFESDVLVFNTHKAAMLSQIDMLRTPTILMTDVTPAQYDRMAALYEHEIDESAAIRALKHRLNVLNFRLARGLVVSSQWARDSLIEEYGVAPERTHIIPIGLDTEYWSPAPRVARTKPRLLFVGGNFERKGGLLLLDVFRSLGLHHRAELHIVTRDQVEPHPGVVVHHNVSSNTQELLELYQQADVFVLPTLADCFGNATLEAMGTSLPVITTAMGGIPDIVDEGKTGFLLPPGDGKGLATALTRLIDDAGTREAFGRAARARAVARFDARTNARRLLDVAHTLAEEHRTRRPATAVQRGEA